MSGLLQHFERWLRRFDSLPVVTIASAAVTDDDTQWWGDLRYLEELADAILDQARVTPSAARYFESGLWRPLLEFDTDMYIGPWPVDKAGLMIAVWRGPSGVVAA